MVVQSGKRTLVALTPLCRLGDGGAAESPRPAVVREVPLRLKAEGEFEGLIVYEVVRPISGLGPTDFLDSKKYPRRGKGYVTLPPL